MSPPTWTSLPLPTPSHPLGCHRAPGWAPCIIQQIPTGCLFYIGNIYVSLLLLSHVSRVWLCNPIEGSPPGSPVPGILQARTLEWVAISLSNAWKWKVKVRSLSRAQLFVTPWTAAYQAPLSVGSSRQECWSGLPLPSLLGNSNSFLNSLFNFPQSICQDAPWSAAAWGNESVEWDGRI